MKNIKFSVHFGLASCFIFILTGCNQQKNNDLWPIINPLPLSIDIESQIDEMLPKLTLEQKVGQVICLLYTSPSPRDGLLSRMPSSA